ncbi:MULTISPECIES: hypothetical protein [unclassified Streptomyces]|nr:MULTISPECIES: hypothetical protein [unclassified Streptomyces]MCX4991064.1 hypothetical protein [Streptomyces sp. NBC_00568]MCX5003699.1 hypothetical protein [Streptomyces sp. NBC_00638]
MTAADILTTRLRVRRELGWTPRHGPPVNRGRPPATGATLVQTY